MIDKLTVVNWLVSWQVDHLMSKPFDEYANKLTTDLLAV